MSKPEEKKRNLKGKGRSRLGPAQWLLGSGGWSPVTSYSVETSKPIAGIAFGAEKKGPGEGGGKRESEGFPSSFGVTLFDAYLSQVGTRAGTVPAYLRRLR